MAVQTFIDLEFNNLDEFTSTVTDGGDLSVSSAAALGDSKFGLSCLIDDQTDIYGAHTYIGNNPNPLGNVRRFRFYIDPNTLTMGADDNLDVLILLDSSNNERAKVELSFSGGYRIRFGVQEDDTTWAYTDYISVSDEEHFIDGLLERASSAVASDGELTLWLNRTTSENISGLDVYDITEDDRCRFGAMNIDAGISDTLYLDELIIQDDDNPIWGRVLAFPSAVGDGAYTRGGRGGTIYKITNTNNSGAGSLREAMTASGPRIIVFDVDGTIDLGSSKIEVVNPYLTVAGQTAPGDGICVKGMIEIDTHDVILMYIRIRSDTDSESDPDDIDTLHLFANNARASRVLRNVIIDHCSVSWGVDSVGDSGADGDIDDNRRITWQYCIISEGLHNSVHSEGTHSTGMIVGDDIKSCTFYKCIFTQNRTRNPWIRPERVDFINNIIYNSYYHTKNTVYPSYINVIGNTHIDGIGNFDNIYSFSIDDATFGVDTAEIYVSDNFGSRMSDEEDDQWDYVGQDGTNAANSGFQVVTPHSYLGKTPTLTERSAAYTEVLANAGASLNRDSNDDRLITDIEDETGSWINDPSNVGGWPSLASGTPETDTDSDGMPDSWETTRGTNPAVDDSANYDLHGSYTNIEVYIYGISGDDPLIPRMVYITHVVLDILR